MTSLPSLYRCRTACRASSTELITPSVGPGGPSRCESIEFQPLLGSACPPVVAIDLPAAKMRGPPNRHWMTAPRRYGLTSTPRSHSHVMPARHVTQANNPPCQE